MKQLAFALIAAGVGTFGAIAATAPIQASTQTSRKFRPWISRST